MVFILLNLLAIADVLLASTGAKIETDFAVPLHYTTDQAGDGLFLQPPSTDKRMTCMYGISPSRASTGSLEADADKALAVAVPPEYVVAPGSVPACMRGKSAAGWPFFWRRAEYNGQFKGGSVSIRAMAMVFPAGSGRVNVVFGIGPVETCSLDDASFAQLFHSLRPHGWQPDMSDSLSRQVVGTWSSETATADAAYVFTQGGRYTFLTMFKSDPEAGGKDEGRYEIQGDELIMNSDNSNEQTQRARVMVYERRENDHWDRGMTHLFKTKRHPFYYLMQFQWSPQR